MGSISFSSVVIFKRGKRWSKDNSIDKSRNQEIGFLIPALGNFLPLAVCLTQSL